MKKVSDIFTAIGITLWHNFVEEMKMHALCSNFDGSVPLKGLSRSHQTIWRLLLMGPTNILHQYCLNET